MTEEQNNQSKILAPPPPPPPPQPKLKPTSASQSQKAIQGKCESRSKLLSPLIERAISSLQWRKGSGSERFIEVELKGNKLRILQKPGGEERNEGTGGTVWDCALVMSKYFEKLSETQNWSNKTVLEVGSGTGIVGIVATLLMKPKVMIITDISSQLPLMEQNVNESIRQLPHNEDLKKIKVQEFDWCKEEVTLDPPPPYDIVIASDCIFPKLNNQWLVNALLKVTSPETLVLIGYEYRTASSRQNFFQKAEEFFICERIPESELHPAFIVDDIMLYRLQRKK